MEDATGDPRGAEDAGTQVSRRTRPDSGVRHRVASRCQRNTATWWLYRVTFGVAADQGVYRTSLSAAGVAFWLLIAIFPAAMAVVSVFGLIMDPQEIAALLGGSDAGNTGSLMVALRAQLERFAQADTGTLSMSLIISLVVVLWSASVLVYGASRAIRMTYGLPPVGYVRLRLQCLAAAAAMVVLIGVVAILFDALDRIGGGLAGPVRDVFSIAVVLPLRVVTLAAVLMALVRFSVGQVARFRRIWPGVVASSVLVLAAFWGFGPYVAVFGDQYEIYGAAAGAVVGMLLAWIACYVVLLGVIANTVLDSMGDTSGGAGSLADRARLREARRRHYREESLTRGRRRQPRGRH